MAINEDEKRIARAYNIGYLLAKYEPELLSQLAKNNKRNEFVKVMSTARDHYDFNNNEKRKDFTPEYKNGFYNAKSLIENNPKLLDRLIATKGFNKDYLGGMEAGKKEYELRKATEKVKNEPKPVATEYKPDYLRGFNVGYQLSSRHGDVLKLAIDTQRRWSPYIQGIQAGQKHYYDDLNQGYLKDGKSVNGSQTDKNAINDSAREKAIGLKENAERKFEELNAEDRSFSDGKEHKENELFNDFMPSWLRDDFRTDTSLDTGKDKDDLEIDPDKD